MKKLPDVELEVMQAIWMYSQPVFSKEIEQVIQNKHPMALTTLLTLLSRLKKKGFVKIEKKGRVSLYSALISKEEYLATQSQLFIKKLCDGNLTVFASALCDSGLSKEDIQELRTLLKKGEL